MNPFYEGPHPLDEKLERIAYSSVQASHALCRIADALETLIPHEHPDGCKCNACRTTIALIRIADASDKREKRYA